MKIIMCRRFAVHKVILIIVTILAKLDMKTSNMVLKIGTWNMRGNDTSKSYIIDMFRTYDILAISEQQLYECQLPLLGQIHPAIRSHAKSSIHLKDRNVNRVAGFRGVCILWQDDLPLITKPLYIGSDRICGLWLTDSNDDTLYIVAVYMPLKDVK